MEATLVRVVAIGVQTRDTLSVAPGASSAQRSFHRRRIEYFAGATTLET